MTDPHLDSRIGSLLADKDEDVVRAALETIGKLGSPAIALNSVQIGRLAETSTNKEFVALARQLLDRQISGQ